MPIPTFEVLLQDVVIRVFSTHAQAKRYVARLIASPNGPFNRPWIRESSYTPRFS